MNTKYHSFYYGPEVFHLFRSVEYGCVARNTKEVNPKGLGDPVVAFARDTRTEYFGAIIGHFTGNQLDIPNQTVFPGWHFKKTGALIEGHMLHEVEWISKTRSGNAEVVWFPKSMLSESCNQQGFGHEDDTKRIFMYVLKKIMNG